MYYLAYGYKYSYIPIDLSHEEFFIEPKESRKILNIIKFTTSFTDEKSLKEYLYRKGLIPNVNCQLAYVIKKNNQDDISYQPLLNGKNICTSEERRFFEIDHNFDFIYKHRYNEDFITRLYAFYLRKLGVRSDIYHFFSQPTQRELAINSLKSLKENYPSSLTLRYIDMLIESLQEKDDLDNETLYFQRLNLFFNSNNLTDQQMISLFSRLRAYFSKGRLMIFYALEEMYNASRNINEVSDSDGFDYEEDLEFRKALNLFFESALYKRENYYPRQIQQRSLVDLGLFLREYSAYLQFVEERRYSSQQHLSIEQEDEKEEFLEEEDFERYNTTSEEAGYRLRKQDCHN